MTCRSILLALLAAQVASSLAFSARSVVTHPSTSSSTRLSVTASSISEQEASYMMAKARECAFSDSCSIEESNEHLIDVLNIQVACASGSVAGHDVCDDQQEVAEVVAKLRAHVQNGAHGLTSRQKAFSGGLLPVYFLALTCASMLLVNAANPNVVPFTFQEVMWATRDGYLDDLVHHFLQNGGLLVSDADIVPFTGQEVMWAIRDGYLDDMFSHFLRNGGL